MNKHSNIPRIANLPGTLVNQIAAGEVIERPASVVKELVENAIDAGATRIDIMLEGGGTENIVIRDNGNGIHPDDMELAIRRHSTSKLQSQQELVAIRSLGFRGEALASIASIADFSLTSRLAILEEGRRLEYEPYTGESTVTMAAHQTGTTVEVRKLFQAIPARRKFLRSERTEFLHIQEMVRRFILGHFGIAFYFYHNGKLLLGSPAMSGDPRPRLAAILGGNFCRNAWGFDSSVDGMRLWGWLGNDRLARSTSDRQYLYLNHRIIRDRHLNHAVRRVLSDIIPDARYPVYLMHLEVDPERVDVNVHPTKQEVRFRNPRDVHDIVYSVLSETIAGQCNGIIQAEDSTMMGTGTAAYRGPTLEYQGVKLRDMAALYGGSHGHQRESTNDGSALGRPLAMLHGRYVIATYGSDLRILDLQNLRQHYLQRRFSHEFGDAGVRHRPLLVPVNLDMDEKLMDAINNHLDTFTRLGLELQQTGPVSLAVRTIPVIIPELDIRQAVTALGGALIHCQTDADKTVELSGILAGLGSACPDIGDQDELVQQLKLVSSVDLPCEQRDLPGMWRTLSADELREML